MKDHQLPTKIASFVPGDKTHIWESREGRRQVRAMVGPPLPS